MEVKCSGTVVKAMVTGPGIAYQDESAGRMHLPLGEVCVLRLDTWEDGAHSGIQIQVPTGQLVEELEKVLSKLKGN